MSVIDKCIVILSKTHDGNDLTGGDLSLLEAAVNDFDNFTDLGKARLEEVYKQAVLGTYTRPWHMGVENLTKDTQGYVYWKGIEVEHYSFRDYDREKEAAQRLAQRCIDLESRGVEVSGSALWAAY